MEALTVEELIGTIITSPITNIDKKKIYIENTITNTSINSRIIVMKDERIVYSGFSIAMAVTIYNSTV